MSLMFIPHEIHQRGWDIKTKVNGSNHLNSMLVTQPNVWISIKTTLKRLQCSFKILQTTTISSQSLKRSN